MLVEKLKLERDLSRNPLFDTIFSMLNKMKSDYRIGELVIAPVEAEMNISKFDITLQAVEINDELHFEFQYCISLFEKETIMNMQNDYIDLLHQDLKQPSCEVVRP